MREQNEKFPEGLGVRAKQRALPANSEPKRCALTPYVPLSRRAGEGERAAPLSHAVGEGLGVRAEKRARPANSEPERCTLTPCADKGTSVRHRIAAAGAIFPSGCVGRQARRLPSPPVSPSPAGRERGIVKCGSGASALQIGQRAAPLSHAVGEGLGVRAKKRVCSPRSEPKCCTLISTPCVPLSRRAGEGERAAPLSHAVGEGLGVRAVRRGILSNTSGGRYSLS